VKDAIGDGVGGVVVPVLGMVRRLDAKLNVAP
jgi:hypothetical protein